MMLNNPYIAQFNAEERARQLMATVFWCSKCAACILIHKSLPIECPSCKGEVKPMFQEQTKLKDLPRIFKK